MNRLGLLLLAWLLSVSFQLHAAPRPNIVFVITDDQGCGDLGHTSIRITRS